METSLEAVEGVKARIFGKGLSTRSYDSKSYIRVNNINSKTKYNPLTKYTCFISHNFIHKTTQRNNNRFSIISIDILDITVDITNYLFICNETKHI